MDKHGLAFLATVWCGALAAGGCCCAPGACGDYTAHDIVAAAPCEPLPCGEACAAPACEPCNWCGVNGPCPKHHGSRGLLGYLRDSICCSSTCGEFYIHPWINDPPHRCDPCDDYGHWIGPQPCGTDACGVACPVSWRNLWGHRSDAPGCCGAHPVDGLHAMDYEGGPYEGEAIGGGVLHSPTPAELPEPPSDEMEGSDLPPKPPEFPGPAAGAPKTRSALKKIDGRPAVYYRRRY